MITILTVLQTILKFSGPRTSMRILKNYTKCGIARVDSMSVGAYGGRSAYLILFIPLSFFCKLFKVQFGHFTLALKCHFDTLG